MDHPTGTPWPAPSCGADEVLAFTAGARARALRAEADQLIGALRWAQLHQADTPEDPRNPWEVSGEYLGQGRWVPLAGEGTPWVEEFCVAELAAALRLSEQAGVRLVGDALELAYRLPLTWARVTAGDLPAWRARKVAERTRRLSPRAAAWMDRQVAPCAHQLSEGRVRDLVEAAILRFDVTHPEGEEPSDGRGVDVQPIGGGQSYVRALLDAADGEALDATVSKVASTLQTLGDDASEDVRRSRALGILADPQLALDLLDGRETDPAHRTRAGAAPGAATQLTLYVHASAADLAAGRGVARVEGRGPVSLDVVREWAGKAAVTVRPVIDLAAEYVADAYEVPDTIREQVLARDPVCVFPWCGARSHRRDIDHIVPFDTGPPGRTRSGNLAPLCRFHHRLKTHGGWTYHRDLAGIYHWASPRGHTYTVSRRGTHAD